jgi:hypothetical protein
MRKEEVIDVMSKFGFVNEHVTTTGETFQIGYWEYPKQNKKGESLTVEVNSCYNEKSPRCLPVLWYKNGWTDRLILNYWSVRSYVHDPDGNCYGRYDFTKLSDDGKSRVIDFDWILENTIENLEKMVAEMLRRFNA